jgi:hypothetical protein
MSVTIALIATSLFNLLVGEQTWYYSRWLLMIGTIAALYCIQFGIMNRLEWKGAISYNIAEFVFWYVGLGAYLFGSGWMSIRLQNLVVYTGIMILSSLTLNRYHQVQVQLCAEEINKALEDEQKN